MLRRITQPLIVAALGCAVLAAPAGAASAGTASYGPNACGDVIRFQFVAAPGERNNVVVGSVGEQRLPGATGCPAADPFALPNSTTITDLSNAVSTVGCAQLTGFAVTCLGHQVIALLVVLRDGDDSATIANVGVKAFVHGEEGDDRISVLNGRADEVTCGSGEDVVTADAADTVAADCEVVL